jgi:magnesium chelatase family protein
MATGLAYSVALDGINGRLVTVEADISNGVPGWALSGLADACISEARDRCRAAIINSGHDWPDRRITVAMYPADVPKGGSHYDLAIALALLIAKGVVPPGPLRTVAVFGELALDGRIRAVPGVLPAVLTAADTGLRRVIVPSANVAEARLVGGVEVSGVSTLEECVALLRGDEPSGHEAGLALYDDDATGYSTLRPVNEEVDLADVRGQRTARWCVEVAAAGGHHLFLKGPPGAGKTMLAERFPRLLPDLDLEQSIEVSQIHSVAGLLSRSEPRITRPPYLAPNHTDTVPSVLGGGSRLVKPGAISLAHHGVLFMDEAPEFRPTVHDALRQPLESGEISIRRAEGAARFPARFQLILAANPCPCGFFGIKGTSCDCQPIRVRRYHDRISGPVRDRIDITHTVLPLSRAEMRQPVGSEHATAAVADRVLEARARQDTRFVDLPWRTNGEVPGYEFRRRCPLPADVVYAVEDEVLDGKLTQRGADRVNRLAWTLADLAGCDRPSMPHVQEALWLRTNGSCGKEAARQEVA